MPRRPRRGMAGLVFHVMNRGARRLPLFDGPPGYEAFVDVLREATDRMPMRLLCYVVMPNHWHLVVWPEGDDDLVAFMTWMTVTHSRRWHALNNSVGTGTIYQGRYKAIPVKDDGHLLTVCRYVERNPVRARLVARSEDWTWSSASLRVGSGPRLDAWPVARPTNWHEFVNAAGGGLDLQQLREAIRRGTPFGPRSWCHDTAHSLGWCAGQRSRGRPPLLKCGRN